MKRAFIIFMIIQFFSYPILGKAELIGYDTDTIRQRDHDEYVYTPFGLALKSNVHYINNSHFLNIKDDQIQVVNAKLNTVNQIFKKTPATKASANKSNTNSNQKHSLYDSGYQGGWITYAHAQINADNPMSITYFSSNYVVPSKLRNGSSQLIYLFNGLQGDDSVRYILQPVLQWGFSPAGGGDYWAICNWLVSENSYFYDSLITVNPGTRLKGEIKATAVSNNFFNYYSSFAGYSSGLKVNNIHELNMPLVALEAYNFDGSLEYPTDEKIRMTNIQIMSDSLYTPVLWLTIDPVTFNKDRQFTRIVNWSNNNGEIDIHFHTPYSVDNFDEIHIYPNPVDDFIHISTNAIKDPLLLFPDRPITNFKLEIYNNLGKLIQSSYYENMDNEFDLDMQNFNAGLYIFKFTYDSKSHAFKIIKN
jgi:Secretion system C-terminal sorting domain